MRIKKLLCLALMFCLPGFPAILPAASSSGSSCGSSSCSSSSCSSSSCNSSEACSSDAAAQSCADSCGKSFGTSVGTGAVYVAGAVVAVLVIGGITYWILSASSSKDKDEKKRTKEEEDANLKLPNLDLLPSRASLVTEPTL